MEVKINKEIRNYTESMFFGLSMRQFLFSLAACGVAVGLFFLFRGRFGMETTSWMCMIGASPFAVMGFVRYNGMTAEQFIWAWMKSEIMMPKRLLFLKNTIEAKEKEFSPAKKKRRKRKRRAARRKAARKRRKQAKKAQGDKQ